MLAKGENFNSQLPLHVLVFEPLLGVFEFLLQLSQRFDWFRLLATVGRQLALLRSAFEVGFRLSGIRERNGSLDSHLSIESVPIE